MKQPQKKLVNAILSMYEKEMVKYPYFKMIFSIDDSNLHIRIKTRGQNHGLVYGELVDMYMLKGLSKKDSMYKAREIVCDFYTACDSLTKKGESPFVAIINEIDPDKVLNFHQNNHDTKESTLGED